MLARMDTPPAAARRLIERVYRHALALQRAGLKPDELRPAVLITMEEAFALLDAARGQRWQMTVPVDEKRPGRDIPYRLILDPQPGMAWARLFGVLLIVESDVIPGGVH